MLEQESQMKKMKQPLTTAKARRHQDRNPLLQSVAIVAHCVAHSGRHKAKLRVVADVFIRTEMHPSMIFRCVDYGCMTLGEDAICDKHVESQDGDITQIQKYLITQWDCFFACGLLLTYAAESGLIIISTPLA